MSPLANSPPSSTPEPEMGSLPQDAAIVPKSATSQVLTGTNSLYEHFVFGASRFSSQRFPASSGFSGFADWNTHTLISLFLLCSLNADDLFSQAIKNQHVFRCRTLRTGFCLPEESLLPPFLIPFHFFLWRKWIYLNGPV